MNNKILSERLKSKRKEMKITQKELADILEVAPSVIAGAETKRGISKSLASKLSVYFNTDIEFWINDDAENDFYKEVELFETTKTVVNRLIDENILTLNNLDKFDNDIKELILQSIKFDIKVALKKKEQH